MVKPGVAIGRPGEQSKAGASNLHGIKKPVLGPCTILDILCTKAQNKELELEKNIQL